MNRIPATRFLTPEHRPYSKDIYQRDDRAPIVRTPSALDQPERTQLATCQWPYSPWSSGRDRKPKALLIVSETSAATLLEGAP